jgi:hypothetical protein
MALQTIPQRGAPIHLPAEISEGNSTRQSRTSHQRAKKGEILIPRISCAPIIPSLPTIPTSSTGLSSITVINEIEECVGK